MENRTQRIEKNIYISSNDACIDAIRSNTLYHATYILLIKSKW